MRRKVCVVTGTRAEYGLLRGVVRGIHEAPDLTLQLLVTGTHLAPRFGLTVREIEADGFPIDRKIEILEESDSAAAVARAMGRGLIGFGEAFESLHPDLLVLLGDRFETLAAAAAATVACVPILHLHGGELSEGAYDDAIRHAVTKLSHLHGVAAEAYRQRVIQLGEDPARVFVVGGLGVDAVHRTELLSRRDLEADLGLTFGPVTLLVTMHPETLDPAGVEHDLGELLAALDASDAQVIFTMPNADTGGYHVRERIAQFVSARPRAAAFDSLGQRRYLSCVSEVNAVVGNSSSGLIEAPTLGTPTVNIGDRQHGRLRAASVLDCRPQRDAIRRAIAHACEPGFRDVARGAPNPYGEGGASERIVQLMRAHRLEGLCRKAFHDRHDGVERP